MGSLGKYVSTPPLGPKFITLYNFIISKTWRREACHVDIGLHYNVVFESLYWLCSLVLHYRIGISYVILLAVMVPPNYTTHASRLFDMPVCMYRGQRCLHIMVLTYVACERKSKLFQLWSLLLLHLAVKSLSSQATLRPRAEFNPNTYCSCLLKEKCSSKSRHFELVPRNCQKIADATREVLGQPHSFRRQVEGNSSDRFQEISGGFQRF